MSSSTGARSAPHLLLHKASSPGGFWGLKSSPPSVGLVGHGRMLAECPQHPVRCLAQSHSLEMGIRAHCRAEPQHCPSLRGEGRATVRAERLPRPPQWAECSSHDQPSAELQSWEVGRPGPHVPGTCQSPPGNPMRPRACGYRSSTPKSSEKPPTSCERNHLFLLPL